MIFTGNYSNFINSNYNTVSIFKDISTGNNYVGNYYFNLFPNDDIITSWKNNIENLNKTDNAKYYIERYYDEVLKNLDPEKVYNDLNNRIILSNEDSLDFSHRHIVSAWLELLLDIEISEVIINGDLLEPTYKPSYIKDMLEEYMISITDMKIFSTLRGVYLYEKEMERIKEEAKNYQLAKYYPNPYYLLNNMFIVSSNYYMSFEENQKVKSLKMNI